MAERPRHPVIVRFVVTWMVVSSVMMLILNGTSMNTVAHLDILKRQKDGTFVWVDMARNLEAAKARLLDLSAASPGEYFVFDPQVLEVVADIRRETGSK